MTGYQPKQYDDLDTFFMARGMWRRPDGSWWEDSYDYGVWWKDADNGIYRLTWIGPVGRDGGSGELYAVRQSGPHVEANDSVTILATGSAIGRVLFFGTIPPADDKYADRNVEALLDGWADVCGTANSLGWVEYIVGQAVEHGKAVAP